MLDTFSVLSSTPLLGDVDLDEVLATVPPGGTVRGMFCARHAKTIAAPWKTVAPHLEAPPAKGSYLAFDRYPMRDYQRLLDLAARERAGANASSTREAYRLMGRGEVEVFAASMFGKVALAMMTDPGTVLTRYPELLTLVADGIGGHATRENRRVTLSFPHFVGAAEQTVGTLEGVVMMMRATPRTTVRRDGPSATFVVTW